MQIDQKEKTNALKRSRLFAHIGEGELERLARRARTVELKSGDLLFSAGEPSLGLFVVVRGRTRAFRHGTDGREQIMHEDEPGATFPEVAVFDEGPYPSSVVAIEPSILLFLPKAEVRQFCLDHPEVALAALKILSRRLRRATGMVEDFALRQVAQRLGEFLLKEFESHFETIQSDLVLEIGYTNQEIADSIGTVREVVSRSFSKLQKQGWIEKSGRVVRLVDLEGLEEYIEAGD